MQHVHPRKRQHLSWGNTLGSFENASMLGTLSCISIFDVILLFRCVRSLSSSYTFRQVPILAFAVGKETTYRKDCSRNTIDVVARSSQYSDDSRVFFNMTSPRLKESCEHSIRRCPSRHRLIERCGHTDAVSVQPWSMDPDMNTTINA